MKISIIGAGGHVGIPFSLVCAEAGHEVNGIDLDKDRVLLLNSGVMPFKEEDALRLLRSHVGHNLKFTTDPKTMADADIIVVMIGTPVDAEGNPRVDDVLEVADMIEKYSKKSGVSVILRSTVAPGTTRLFYRRLYKNMTGRTHGFVYFIPERVLQGKGIEETKKHKWMIGTDWSLDVGVKEFIHSLNVEYTVMKWEEAEVGKLMTNMYRYVNFAFANEMQIIGDNFDVNIFKVIESFNEGYDRLNVPLPGPNVGGPCLFKDGKFLTAGIQFPEMIQTAFNINEGMPEYVLNKVLKNSKHDIDKLIIMGAAFKANSDDIRNSLTFKLRKACVRRGIETFIYDPHVPKYSNKPVAGDMYDAMIVMTPHDEFYKAGNWLKGNWGIYFTFYDPWKNKWEWKDNYE